MPKFHVIDACEINQDRKFFVMAGHVVEGEIKVGMLIHVPFNSALSMTAKIHKIEFARRAGEEVVCLCFDSEQDELELWHALNIRNETLEIAEEDNVE